MFLSTNEVARIMIGKSAVLVLLFLGYLDVSQCWTGVFGVSEFSEKFYLQHDTPSVRKSAEWLLSQKLERPGWGEETPRAIVALASAGVSLLNNDDLSMRQQLFVNIAMDLIKNDSQTQIPLHRLAQHVRSLIATCQDPARFYGRNLVQELRFRTSKILKPEGITTVLPSLVLTLCLANKVEDNDLRSVGETAQSVVNRRYHLKRYDLEAYSSIASACLMQRTSRYMNTNGSFFDRLNATVHGYINNVKKGDVYTLALLLQAINAWSSHPAASEFDNQKEHLKRLLLDHQGTDGSFGDILATYYALPAIADRSLLDLYTTCSNGTEPFRKVVQGYEKSINIEILLWVTRNGKIESNCIKFAIEEGSTLYDAMKWAQLINPVFKFKTDSNRNGIFIYEIYGIPNDIEKTLRWCLYVNPVKTASNVDVNTGSKMQPLDAGLNFVRPKDGDKFLFWYRHI